MSLLAHPVWCARRRGCADAAGLSVSSPIGCRKYRDSEGAKPEFDALRVARGHRWSPRVGVVDSVEVFGEQRGRQVALTEVGEDDDDALAGVLLTRGDGLGGRERGTGGDAHEQALLLRDLTGPVEGGVVVDGDDL